MSATFSNFSRPTRALFLVFLVSLGARDTHAQMAAKVVREKVAGIDLVADKTDVKDVVTFAGSLPAGDCFAPPENIAVPTLVGELLDQGTTRQDKFAIAQKLDDIGAKIDFEVHGVMVEFSGKCLRKNLPVVVPLLAEELRSPAFSVEEFEKVKKQITGNFQRAQESTEFRASQAFANAIFPRGHPNYAPPTPEFLAAIATAKLADVKKFHADYYGPAQMTLVVVGDIDLPVLQSELAKAFTGWTGGKTVPDFPRATAATAQRMQVITMADKPSVSVTLGQATGMRYRDRDALALRLGNAVLGSGFTGRLMANVRDREGLTYGIRSEVADDSIADGAWQITASFAPPLLAQGMASTRRELDQWYSAGVTAAEFQRVKANLIGTFKVGLATTDGLADALLNAIQRGYDATWLDEYPKRVEAISLAEVNAAIKRHLQPEKMTLIEAGSIPTSPDK